MVLKPSDLVSDDVKRMYTERNYSQFFGAAELAGHFSMRREICTWKIFWSLQICQDSPQILGAVISQNWGKASAPLFL